MKLIIGLAFVVILGALASAGVFMLRRPREGDDQDGRSHMARALTVRIGVSVAVFLFVLLSWFMGWIQPTGVPLKPI
ncbi:DUF2909 domain-containing protein [Sphaerotilus mobilis]|uniref:DUF2909 family protein n=1 Tax=Sphaerotilus mobilis TaxID=47994 RepID=A0A4Q7LLR7_9BURK|nr:DUF2909 domain-containing protein [Sphaerotilus mobilis]RZS54499.1 DUF2909 family protein [Sphaerotilus mobilis]